ncbi:MAG TPA: ATP-binding protein, partial [Leptospiraceae bacterium]|nr:ATP-binding protein [Leptospiraceae bacterium]
RASAVIIIEDNGPGIPGDPGKLFEPFFRGAAAKPGGLGLGLSIAKSVVELHGGSIVATRTDTGSRFRIELPLEKS